MLINKLKRIRQKCNTDQPLGQREHAEKRMNRFDL